MVEVSDGATLTSTEGFGIDAVLTDVGNTAGTVSVTSGGAVTADVLSGIRARNSAGNAGAVTVAVTGGSVTTKGTRKHAVEALQEGTGDAIVDVSDGAAITSRQNAGILARLRLAGNDEGQVKVTQGGTIAGRTGVHAHVSRDSVVTIAAGTTTTETRGEAAGPVIDIIWTGSFSHGTTATVAQDDSDRWAASDATLALTHHRTVEAGKATRYGTPAGIEAQVMSWNDVAARVAEADDPGMIMDNTEQMNLLSESHADSQRTEILRAFKAALGNGDIDVADGVFDAVKTGETSLDDVTEAEIVTYLSTDDDDTRTLLRNVLKYSLSEAEMAVLRAAVTDTGLDAALDDEDAGFSDIYKTAVKVFLQDRNVGDISIAMNGGSIASRGDGIRAYYATPHAMNGAIDVTVAAGTTVSGGMAGIYVANAGLDMREAGGRRRHLEADRHGERHGDGRFGRGGASGGWRHADRRRDGQGARGFVGPRHPGQRSRTLEDHHQRRGEGRRGRAGGGRCDRQRHHHRRVDGECGPQRCHRRHQGRQGARCHGGQHGLAAGARRKWSARQRVAGGRQGGLWTG